MGLRSLVISGLVALCVGCTSKQAIDDSRYVRPTFGDTPAVVQADDSYGTLEYAVQEDAVEEAPDALDVEPKPDRMEEAVNGLLQRVRDESWGLDLFAPPVELEDGRFPDITYYNLDCLQNLNPETAAELVVGHLLNHPEDYVVAEYASYSNQGKYEKSYKATMVRQNDAGPYFLEIKIVPNKSDESLEIEYFAIPLGEREIRRGLGLEGHLDPAEIMAYAMLARMGVGALVDTPEGSYISSNTITTKSYLVRTVFDMMNKALDRSD